MKECKNCGFINLDTQQRCLKCNYILEHQESANKKVKFRFNILGRLLYPLNFLQYRISLLLKSHLPDDVSHRRPFLAGLASLFPGGGALYNHQPKKMLFIIILYTILVFISVSTIREPFSNYILAGLAAFIFICYTDAFATALLINGELWTLRYSAAMFSYLLFIVGLTLTLGQFFLVPVFMFVHVKQDVFTPVIRVNDRLFVDCLTYRFRAPRRGEIIYYNPQPFTFFHGSNWYVVKEKNTFERIIAIPGDTVKIENGVIYLNGTELAPQFYPIGKLFPQDREIKVPEKKYLAIFSHLAEDSGMIFGIGSAKMPIMSIQDFEKTCFVEKKDIHGRVLALINPPPRRRFF